MKFLEISRGGIACFEQEDKSKIGYKLIDVVQPIVTNAIDDNSPVRAEFENAITCIRSSQEHIQRLLREIENRLERADVSEKDKGALINFTQTLYSSVFPAHAPLNGIYSYAYHI